MRTAFWSKPTARLHAAPRRRICANPDRCEQLSEAKLLVINGSRFEGWISRLEQSSGCNGPLITASKGVKPRYRVVSGFAFAF